MAHTIVTERLVLKTIAKEDIEFMRMLESRPETNRFETEGTPDEEQVQKKCLWFMEKETALPQEGAILWIVTDKSGNRLGEVQMACNWETTNEWEIGYKFLSEYWGHGYAAETVRAAIEYAFGHFVINRLAAFINAENIRSVALARRIGMVEEGRIREVRLVNGVRNDEFVFSLLKREFARVGQ